MDIDLKQIRDLLSVVSETDITELTIEDGDKKITVKKGHAAPVQMVHAETSMPVHPSAVALMKQPPTTVMSFDPRPAAQPAETSRTAVAAAAPAEPANDKANGYVPITSPMVGTFYRSPSPTAAPFVSVGDSIAVGQTICIIEAMKLMNDMPSEVSGKIVKICVDNGTTVEYGQALFMVDPKG